MSSLLNRSQVRERALSASRDIRKGRFTRVGKEFLDRLDAKVDAIIVQSVAAHASVGITLKDVK